MAAQTAVSHASPHGVKRRAEDNDSTQRLTKRFHLLNIDRNGTPFVPSSTHPTLFTSPPRQLSDSEYMQVDDTKDRIYIHNLDEELAEVSRDNSSEDRLVFLPDIEQHLSGFSKKLLAGEYNQDSQGSELVVYSVPSSLSVPEEEDSVRKAIIESRARARERQDEQTVGSRDAMLHDTGQNEDTELSVGPTNGFDYHDSDPDAMDIG
ncbi:MAG: hypothetical protein M1828_005405 [Chrysothrix sp. TS-e1954]|nr:MAG: hypothetical protein M1828_005405 [Chrysothrix sp. TS-e1954]